MTATNFRDLLAGWLSGDPRFAALPGDYADADEILAMPVPWVDCPTCVAEGFDPVTENDCGPGLTEYLVCPACHGTGKATVAQLLAWGSAIAQTDPEDWIKFSDQRSTVTGYRNRILGVTP